MVASFVESAARLRRKQKKPSEIKRRVPKMMMMKTLARLIPSLREGGGGEGVARVGGRERRRKMIF